MSKIQTEIRIINLYVALAKNYLNYLPELLEHYPDYELKRLKSISRSLKNILESLAVLNSNVDNIPSELGLDFLEKELKKVEMFAKATAHFVQLETY